MMHTASQYFEAINRKTMMNIPNRIAYQQHVRGRRRAALSRLFRDTSVAVTDWLRERHENALRQPIRSVRMRPANATPA